ncbi:multidrug ABC transporter ATP-binding protein [Paenibacillus sp. BIHB 4019]|uniref:Multidrug ABC transporter ATP-binding protein n=1 Tax=Paenibacillus sp. BIHB 4019 TaxID=1870819 RepID=A0A1B2DNS4_9BACL|nr:ATP-binding cassette domain-containing protein [Paenibacillus sp. BIHB 4019]ANY69366.1 multidrug ABC transporter ATP-binding protein [Paenibacillus sp. BIHB 4019]
MKDVHVEELYKSFSYYTKEAGVLHSLKNLFRRNTLVKEAVKGVSFSIEEGEMVAFLGPNGAGKTTTLKMLSGILHPTSGDVSVLGYKPYERKKEFKRQFAIVMGQKSQLWTDLPASESIVLNRYIYQVEERQYRETLDELVELLDVGKILNVQVRRLSLGERMKMELIAALIHRPKLLFLDEPTIGLDIETQQRVRRFLKQYNEQHRTTILLTSHYLKDIEDLCNRAIIISDGSLVFDGEFNRIDDWMNRKKIVKLKFASSVEAEWLAPYGTVMQSNGQVVTMEIGRERIQEVSRELLGRFPIDDITIEDVPIEDVILSLYRRGSLHEPIR